MKKIENEKHVTNHGKPNVNLRVFAIIFTAVLLVMMILVAASIYTNNNRSKVGAVSESFPDDYTWTSPPVASPPVGSPPMPSRPKPSPPVASPPVASPPVGSPPMPSRPKPSRPKPSPPVASPPVGSPPMPSRPKPSRPVGSGSKGTMKESSSAIPMWDLMGELGDDSTEDSDTAGDPDTDYATSKTRANKWAAAILQTIVSETPPKLVKHSELPPLPWPPPMASAFARIPDKFIRKSEPLPTSLGDATGKLQRALKLAGYSELSFFSTPNGIALITRIEKVNKDGTPVTKGRWETERLPLRKFDPKAYLSRLFKGDPGLFRVFVFIMASEHFPQHNRAVARTELMDLLNSGHGGLPSTTSDVLYGKKFQTNALVYEFLKTSDEEPSLAVPSSINGEEHLIRSGILIHLKADSPKIK